MRILGVIPARGGSKSIPRKNIYPLKGKPLILYAVEEAKKSKHITDLIVSTDDNEIASIARSAGVEVPFIRPAELSDDKSPSYPVIMHALDIMESDKGIKYNYLIMLQPTAALRKVKHIDESLEMLVSSKADTVVSVVQVESYHPLRMKKLIGKEKYLINYIDQGYENMIPRQELPKVYIRNGAIYATTIESLHRDKSLVGKDCRGYEMGIRESINIDTIADLKMCEILINEN